jgi:hypothetical protein
MGNVILHEIPFANGEMGIQRELVSGGYPCPICGCLWETHPPISPRSDGIMSAMWAMGDVCECDVEMGVDIFDAPGTPIGFMHYLITLLRGDWLERVHWSDDALEQLEARLGVSIEQARQESEHAIELDELLRRIRKGDDQYVRDVVQNRRITLNTEHGTSIPLYVAVQCDQLAIVKCLVEHGAHVAVPDHCPQTPLSLAEKLNKAEIADYLRRVLADGGMPESPSD